MNVVLKGCLRCGGDLLRDQSDREQCAFCCLQCGKDFRIVGHRVLRFAAPERSNIEAVARRIADRAYRADRAAV